MNQSVVGKADMRISDSACGKVSIYMYGGALFQSVLTKPILCNLTSADLLGRMKGSTKRTSPATPESPEKDNSAYLKRREQVRRAQRYVMCR